VAKFQPGQGGRPRGARNRLARKFLDDLLEDWEEHGAAAIRIMRIEHPEKYVAIVAATLPRELHIEAVESELTDDGLDALLDDLVARQESSPFPFAFQFEQRTCCCCKAPLPDAEKFGVEVSF
jgi:hypothetical protein